METPSLEVQSFANEVIRLYLDTGHFHSVKEIADYLKCSESRVRRLLHTASGGLRDSRLTLRNEGRTSYSKSFRGMESGAHSVKVYGPTLETLRLRILQWEGPR